MEHYTSYLAKYEWESANMPPGLYPAVLPCASQPVSRAKAATGHSAQHAYFSTVMEEGPAEQLPLIPERFSTRLNLPKDRFTSGRGETSTLKADRQASSSNITTAAPATTTYCGHGMQSSAKGRNTKAGQMRSAQPTPGNFGFQRPLFIGRQPSISRYNMDSSDKVVGKQEAASSRPSSSASSSSSITPRGPSTPPQPGSCISLQGLPEAAAAATASMQPMSASASASASSSSDEGSASSRSSATVYRMSERDIQKGRKRQRPPPGVRKQLRAAAAAEEAAKEEAAAQQLAAMMVRALYAAAAEADAAEAVERAAAGALLAARAVASLRAAAAAADAAQAAAEQAAMAAAETVLLAGAAEAHMDAAPAALGLPPTALGWAYYCAGAVTGLAQGVISLRG